MEFQRKRHYGPDVSLKGRVSKLGKLEDVSDAGSDEYPPRKFLDKVVYSDCYYGIAVAKAFLFLSDFYVWYYSGKSISIFDMVTTWEQHYQ
jgi:hypothetical protein